MKENKHFLVVGLGLTGWSCIKFLKKLDVKISVFDTREVPPYLDNCDPSISIYLQNYSYDDSVTDVIVSPGLSREHEIFDKFKGNNIPIYGDIELFSKYARAPIVGITGTNGKSTVTAMLGEIAKAANISVAVGGNIGVPALDLLDDKIELYILELSSYQLETVSSLKLAVGCILNITEDHLDRYNSFNDYILAKHNIYLLSDIAVYNDTDELTKVSPGARPQMRQVSCFNIKDTNILDLTKLKILGEQNLLNMAAAIKMAQALNISDEHIKAALYNFTGLRHRCELVINKNNILWINDSKGTNVGATLAAISGVSINISGKIILILGGEGKGQDFSVLEPKILENCRELILIGKSKYELANIFNNKIKINIAESLDEAVNIADKVAKSNDAVLLSPACASFDMFKDFNERGDIFKSLVLREKDYV